MARIVFFGTAEFAVPALRAAAEHVALVVAQPDRPRGRGMRPTPTPVKAAAEELGLPVETPEKSRAADFVERLRSLDADLLLVAAYGQILSQAVLDSARQGGINLHGSILPRYRGAAPIQRCIQAGETQTGVTLMQMDRGMDTGDIIAIERLAIGPDETYGELQARLASLAAEMTVRWLPKLTSGDYPRMPQDHELASHAAKVLKEEAELKATDHAKEAYDRFRAFTPSPGAWMQTAFGRLKVSAARFGPVEGPPGTLLAPDQVALKNGSLRLLQVQLEGKKSMSGRDLANGLRLKPGDRLL
jgi:methionyl-tRNA formyltransferase